MSQAIQEQFANLSEDPEQTARAWKQAGGKVAGYLSNNLPLEIIRAAGMLPLHLRGKPQQPTPLADRFMEPAFDAVTRSILDRLLAGDYDFLDLIVLPRSNDAQQRLYYYLCELKRKHPQFQLPPVFLVDILHSPRDSTAAHNQNKVRQFAAFMAEHGGKAIDEPVLRESIATYNQARGQLQTFTELRARMDVPVSSTLAHQVYSAAQSCPIESFTADLQHLNASLQEQSGQRKTERPVILAGNGLDHPSLHQLLDSLNARMVGDYHSYGNHFLSAQVDENLEPLSALARHYAASKSSRSFLQANEVVEFAQQQGARGIIFFYLQREEALTWHYPQQRKAADAAGLACIGLERQPYHLDSEQLRPLLTDFLDTL